MKITKRQLKRIIREEKQKLIKESEFFREYSIEENPVMMDLWNQMLQAMAAQFPDIDSSYFGDAIFAAMEQEWAKMAREQDDFNQENRGAGSL